MKFAHLADIHLGYEQYNQSWRAEDYSRIFKAAARKIVEENVDFVIIAGDLFHKSIPNPRTLKDAIEVLNIFRENDIPVFAIEGNHDKSIRDISIYHLLESLNLLYVLGLRKKRVETEYTASIRIGDVYLVKGIYDEVEILGDRHRTRWQLKKILPILNPESDKSILVLHQTVKEVADLTLNMGFDLTINELPRANYYALGHIHIQSIYKFNDVFLTYPGSLERYDIRESSKFIKFGKEISIQDGVRKGFIIVEDFKPYPVFVKPRDLIRVEIEAENGDEAESKFQQAMKYSNEECVLITKIACKENIDVKKLHEIASRNAKYAEVRFELIREEPEEVKVLLEHEFFDDFELKLLELLKEDIDMYKSSAYELIKEQFGISKVKRIEDYEAEDREARKKTLLDYIG